MDKAKALTLPELLEKVPSDARLTITNDDEREILILPVGRHCHNAAAELRRLHQFSEDQIGRATAAKAALQMTKATHALKIAAVEAQRDALLEALRWIATVNAMDYEYQQVARAAIKAAEENK
jgi:hypothetical protein